jgi:hypothetical protein
MKSEKLTSANVVIETPRPPNFLRAVDGQAISIADVSDRDLRGIAKRWTELLLLSARNKRKAKR